MHGILRCSWFRFFLYSALLYASFAHNVFCIPDGVFTVRDGFRTNHAGYDSDLVMNRLALARDGVDVWHPMYCDYHERGGGPYKSQFGLQGVVLAQVYMHLGGDIERFAGSVGSVFALLTAMVLAAFFASAARRIGFTTAYVAAILTAFSPVLLPFATSLYWCLFLFFAPFVLVWLLYPRCEGSPVRFAALLAATGALICVKALCGYEFIPTVILGPVTAIVYHRTLAGDGVRKWIAPSAAAIVAGLAGFAVALVLHAEQLSSVLHLDGVNLIFNKASSYTVEKFDAKMVSYASLAPDASILPDAIRYPLRCLLNYLFLPVFGSPTTWGPLRFCVSLWLALLVIGVAVRSVRRNPASFGAAVHALLPAAAIGLVGGACWHVLARTHSCIHAHQNLIVHYVPFLPIAFLLLGAVVERFAARRPFMRGIPWLAVALVVGINWIQSDFAKQSDLETDARAAEQVEAVLQGKQTSVPAVHAFSPTLSFGRMPQNVDAETWLNCRLMANFDGAESPCRLYRGWVVCPKSRDARPTIRIVVAVDDRATPVAVGYSRLTLPERLIGGNHTWTNFVVAAPVEKDSRVRLFSVTADGTVGELEIPR